MIGYFSKMNKAFCRVQFYSDIYDYEKTYISCIYEIIIINFRYRMKNLTSSSYT